MERKKNFICDFDDTLFITLPVTVGYINQRWKINSVKSDYFNNNHKLHEVVEKYTNTKIDRQIFYQDYRKNLIMSEYWNSKLKPMPNMVKIVKELAIKYNFFIATKRIDTSTPIVLSLLNKYIPGCVEGIYNAIKLLGNEHIEMRKRDFILGLPGESIVFLDDSKHEIEMVKDIIPTILFDPYGRYQENEFTKMNSWLEIGEKYL